MGRRNNATLPLFRMVYPEKEGRVVTSHLFSPRTCVKTGDLNSRVNFEHFLIAEANHVQVQPSRCKRQPRATITDVAVLQMGRYEAILHDFH